MAFDNKNLSVIAYSNGFTIWHYCTTDSVADIIANPKYFGKIHTLCARGDIMYITSNGHTETCQVAAIKKEYVEIK